MRSHRFAPLSFVVLSALAVAACKSESPPEPARRDPATTGATTTTSATTTATALATNDQGAGRRPHHVPISPDDPKAGVWTLSDATAGLADAGADLVAKIDTSHGAMTCKLYEDKAPITVANFVGLARGNRPWKDPKSGTWVSRPAYDGTTFHRIIKGFMIQGGDAAGTGAGEPGYVIPDELWGGKHDRAGLLCMANRGADTNGAQFFITDAAAAHLDKGYTIFGECKPETVVHAIANVQTDPTDRPVSPVTIKSVKISRSTF